MAGPIYVALHIETTGCSPIVHSILELGAVAFNSKGGEFAKFNVIIKERANKKREERHMREVWSEYSSVFEELTCSPHAVPIREAFERFGEWIFGLRGEDASRSIHLLAFPASFTIGYIYGFWTKYVNKPLNSWGPQLDCLDVPSYAAASSWCPFPDIYDHIKHFGGKAKKTHRAVSEAREHGRTHFQVRWSFEHDFHEM